MKLCISNKQYNTSKKKKENPRNNFDFPMFGLVTQQ